jgi:hypothetical protein
MMIDKVILQINHHTLSQQFLQPELKDHHVEEKFNNQDLLQLLVPIAGALVRALKLKDVTRNIELFF